ncbi:hypothetical protein [Cloacibacterium normanense]
MNFLKTKYFTPIAFLIFFMPFLERCMKKEVVEFDENIDSVAIFQSTNKVSNISKLSKIDSTRINLNKNKEIETEKISESNNNLNAYEVAEFLPSVVFNKEFEIEDLFFGYSFYTYILLLSILMIVFSWRRKFLRVRNLAVANIILLVISTILLVKTGVIDEFEDVKYGLYVFLMYSILIIYISNKENLELKT